MNYAQAKPFLDFVLEMLVIVVTPLAIMLAHKLTKEFSRRTGVTVAERQATVIDDAVMKGIAYAHEQSRKALKLNAKKLTGDDKYATAVDFVVRMLREQRVPARTRDYIGTLVEARLNADRHFLESDKP